MTAAMTQYLSQRLVRSKRKISPLIGCVAGPDGNGFRSNEQTVAAVERIDLHRGLQVWAFAIEMFHDESSCLFNDEFLSSSHIHALLFRLALQTASIESVPC